MTTTVTSTVAEMTTTITTLSSASAVVLSANERCQQHRPGCILMPEENGTSAQPSPQELEQQDWDALEFSPVYECRERGRLYNQLNSTCITQCPSSADLSHGQCVRPNITTTDINHAALWRLQTYCGVECWKDKSEVSIHFVRLALASHLAIPFQEVGNVLLRSTLETTQSRRLSATSMETPEAFLDISVKSRRLTDTSGRALLASFLPNAAEASQLLGLVILSVELLTDTDVADEVRAKVSGLAGPGENGDVYAPFYEEIGSLTDKESGDSGEAGGGATIAGVAVDGVPAAVVMACGGAILVLGAISAVRWRWWKWRRLPDARTTLPARVVKEETQGKDENEDPQIVDMKLNLDEPVKGRSPNDQEEVATGPKPPHKDVAEFSASADEDTADAPVFVAGHGLHTQDIKMTCPARDLLSL